MRREFSGDPPAGFDCTNLKAELLRDEKKKVLSLAEFDFECEKSPAKRQKFFVCFAWNKHFALCVY